MQDGLTLVERPTCTLRVKKYDHDAQEDECCMTVDALAPRTLGEKLSSVSCSIAFNVNKPTHIGQCACTPRSHQAAVIQATERYDDTSGARCKVVLLTSVPSKNSARHNSKACTDKQQTPAQVVQLPSHKYTPDAALNTKSLPGTAGMLPM